jgi:UDP-N-acetyl-2-amino-2-deoxyglucuronate dehydrogenase
LSVDKNDLPVHAVQNSQPTYRSITVDDKEIDFSGGFTDLHTESYKNILCNKGYGIAEARNSIEIAHLIRNQKITSSLTDKHPFLK